MTWGFERPELAFISSLFCITSIVVLLLMLQIPRLGDLEKRRRRLAVSCRLFTLGLLLFMMSAPNHLDENIGHSNMVFVIHGAERLWDVRKEALDWVSKVISEVDAIQDETRVGVVYAGDDTEWIVQLGQRSEYVGDLRGSEGNQAKRVGRLGAAINAVNSTLSLGDRLLLSTDGRSDRGTLLNLARKMRQKGVELWIHPISGESSTGVVIENITGPVLVREGDEAVFRVALQNLSSNPVRVDLQFLLADEAIRPNLVSMSKGRKCLPGRCVIEHRVSFLNPGNVWVGVRLQGGNEPSDGESDKVAWWAVMVETTPEILFVAGLPGAADTIMAALNRRIKSSSRRRLFKIDPNQLPDDPRALERYGGIVLVNVHESALTTAQVGALHNYLHHHGGGLVTYGGIQAFDRGDYANSELEKLLPVDSEPKPPEPKELDFGLLFVIDVSGSLTGQLGKVKTSVEQLVRSVPLNSTMGIVIFDTTGVVNRKLITIETNEERSKLLKQVTLLTAGGGTNLASGLRKALFEVDDFQSKSKSPHPNGYVIVLSDGILERDLTAAKNLSARLLKRGWKVSCIGISENRSSINSGTLEVIAKKGGGDYSTYPLIPPIADDADTDAKLTYTLSTLQGETVFRLDESQSIMLGSVTEFNRAKRLKSWAQASLRFDHLVNPLGLATGRVGRGRSVVALYDVTNAWSFPLLESRYRDTLLVRPILHSLREENGDMHFASVIQDKDGRSTLLVETNEDFAPNLDVLVLDVVNDLTVLTELELPRIRPHLYGTALPAGVTYPPVIQVAISERFGKDERSIPAAKVPAVIGELVDVGRLRADGPDNEFLSELVERADGKLVITSAEAATGLKPSGFAEVSRFWNGFLAIALLLAICADAASRTWTPRWSIGFYSLAIVLVALAVVVEEF